VNAGNIFKEGTIVAKDLVRAAGLYKLAAEQGHVQAQAMLGE
jgi:TPR repeat protein